MPEHVCFLWLFLELRQPNAGKNVFLTALIYSSEKHNTAFWSQLLKRPETRFTAKQVQMPNCPVQPSAGLSLVYKTCLLEREILSDSLKESPLKKKNSPHLCPAVKYDVLLLLPYQQVQEPHNTEMSKNQSHHWKSTALLRDSFL